MLDFTRPETSKTKNIFLALESINDLAVVKIKYDAKTEIMSDSNTTEHM